MKRLLACLGATAAVASGALAFQCKVVLEGYCYGFAETGDSHSALYELGDGACPGDSTLYGESDDICAQEALVGLLFDGGDSCTGHYIVGQRSPAGTSPGDDVVFRPGIAGEVSSKNAGQCSAYAAHGGLLEPRFGDDCVVATCNGALKPTRCERNDFPGSVPRQGADLVRLNRHYLNYGVEFPNELSVHDGGRVCDIEIVDAFGSVVSDWDSAVYSRTLDKDGVIVSGLSPALVIDDLWSDIAASGQSSCLDLGDKDMFVFRFFLNAGADLETLTAKVVMGFNDAGEPSLDLNEEAIYDGDAAFAPPSDADYSSAHTAALGESISVAKRSILRLRRANVKVGQVLSTGFTYLDDATKWATFKLCSASDQTECTPFLDTFFSLDAASEAFPSNPDSRIRLVDVGDSGALTCSPSAFGIHVADGVVHQAQLAELECVTIPLRGSKPMVQVDLRSNILAADLSDSQHGQFLQIETAVAPYDGLWCMNAPEVCVQVSEGDTLRCALGLSPFAWAKSSKYLDPSGQPVTASLLDPDQFAYVTYPWHEFCSLYPAKVLADELVCKQAVPASFGSTAVAGQSTLKPIDAWSNWRCRVDFTLNSKPSPDGNLFRVGNAGTGVDPYRLPQVDLVSDEALLRVTYTVAGEDGEPILDSDGKWVLATCEGGAVDVDAAQEVDIELASGTVTIRTRDGATATCENMPPMFVPSGEQLFQVAGAGLVAADADVSTVYCGQAVTAPPTSAPTEASTDDPKSSPSESSDCVATKLLVIREETFNARNNNKRLLSHTTFLASLLGSLPIGQGVTLGLADIDGVAVRPSTVDGSATVGAAAAQSAIPFYLGRVSNGEALVDFYQVLLEANAMAGFDPGAPDANAQYDKTVVHILFDGEPVANVDGKVETGKDAFEAACDMRKLQRQYLRDDLLVFCQVTERKRLGNMAKRVNKCVCDGTFMARSDDESAVAALTLSDDIKSEEEAAARMRTFFCRTAAEITTTDPSRCTTKDGDKDKCQSVKASTFGKPVRPDVSEPYSLLFRTGRACNYEAKKCLDKPEQLHNVDGGLDTR